ncbi:methyltransferase domain-containing protein [Snodgrassella sp. CFCC 13594]|uniref:methyltransferase domain-containing protein n=1 Tax=Snodgrassella sp. CFCC 13594 TaxID=1775559 RepID=UPI0009ED88CB|nr:methyltransferase domain-containing protein [Snodgrassella sp. CFCC 13594]
MPRTSQPVYATGVGSLHYRLPEYQVNIAFTPQDFTQVNGRTNALMVHRAMALLQPQADELIVDWFCGLGNFSLPMARLGANVIGIEGVAAMVSKAQANAKANGLSAQAQFGQADLFAVTDIDAVRWGVADKWLLDPPRAGAQALVQALHGLPENKLPKRVVYVSCNPGTLARDAGILVARGYRFSAAGIMNLFAQTAHVESIAVFDWP